MTTITVLAGKKIILGVTGSIANYKAVDLASKLTQAGASVDVVMTASAQKFVTPLTFQAVTGRPVYTDLWQTNNSGGLPTHIAHVGLGEGADLLIVAPITAHSLAKLTHGLADDLLAVTALAVRCSVMIAPAMDGGMYDHLATQANLKTLTKRGIILIEPEEGRFASGLVGKGRLPETPTIMGKIRQVLGREGVLAGKRLVVTAGGTKEAIDPVRFITNHSSGKQGYAIAQAGLDAGAEVVLISTMQTLPIPIGAIFVPVTNAESMHDAVHAHLRTADVLVMASAVADFKPATIATQKIKKSKDAEVGMTLELTRTPDILMTVKTYREKHQRPQVVVGFAAETQNLLENAQGKLERKGLDMIFANDLTADGAGFQTDTNRVTLVSVTDAPQTFDLMSKALVGEMIVAQLAQRFQ